MTHALAERRRDRRMARPVRMLVPLIKADLDRGDSAGMDYYRRAGDKLREARGQVAAHLWTAWLTKHFELSRMTAWRYMRLSEIHEDSNGTVDTSKTLSELTQPEAERARQKMRHARKPLEAAIAGVDVDRLARDRETREKEVKLHRELAKELIDIGWKALSTRLHPDRGGSPDAMRRLNRVRSELKSLAETRRFVE